MSARARSEIPSLSLSASLLAWGSVRNPELLMLKDLALQGFLDGNNSSDKS